MSDSMRPHRQQPTRLPHPWDSLGKNTGVGCHFLLQCMKVKNENEVIQSYPTLSDPWTAAYQAPPSIGFSRQEYWSGGGHCLFQKCPIGWVKILDFFPLRVMETHSRTLSRALAWLSLYFVVIQLLSRVWLFASPWTAACQASLSITNSQSLPKLMSMESVMSSNHLILCCPLPFLPSIFPRIRVFSIKLVLHISSQSIGTSASASVLPMNIQDRFPLGWTGWISLQSKGLSRVFSNTTVQKHQFFGAQLYL